MTRPNILLIQTDQQKATSLDLYNREVNFVETTALRRLADAGVTFDAGYCPYPLCVPSRISMLIGQYPSRCGYVGNQPYPMGDRFETIFSRARKSGYRTMLVGKDHAIGLARDYAKHDLEAAKRGIANNFDKVYVGWHGENMADDTNRDCPQIEPFLKNTPELKTLWGSAVAPWTGAESLSATLSRKAVEWIDEWRQQDKPEGKPFAMWLSYPDPHEFYQAPQDVVDSIDPESLDLPPNWDVDIENRAEYIQYMHWYFNAGGVPKETALKLIRIYLAMCKNVDIQLNQVFDYLQETNEWENTIILYVSDHGDFNGEMQLLQKFNSLYDGCARVPFIAAWPGKGRAGIHCDDPVNLTDIPATICELTGLAPLPGDQGRSFADVMQREDFVPREYTVIESGLPGESLTTRDIANFPDHRYDVTPEGRWCYDPPHRFGGKVYAVRTKWYKLIVREGQRSEFYDMKNDPWETANCINEHSLQSEILRHYEYLAQHLAKIAPRPADAAIAPQDDIYRAGGDTTWSESLAEARRSAGCA